LRFCLVIVRQGAVLYHYWINYNSLKTLGRRWI